MQFLFQNFFKKFSWKLHKWTNNKNVIKEIKIELPFRWKNCPEEKISKLSPFPDFLINVRIQSRYTQSLQAEGCAKKGKFVTLNSVVFNKNQNKEKGILDTKQMPIMKI